MHDIKKRMFVETLDNGAKLKRKNDPNHFFLLFTSRVQEFIQYGKTEQMPLLGNLFKFIQPWKRWRERGGGGGGGGGKDHPLQSLTRRPTPKNSNRPTCRKGERRLEI